MKTYTWKGRERENKYNKFAKKKMKTLIIVIIVVVETTFFSLATRATATAYLSTFAYLFFSAYYTFTLKSSRFMVCAK